MSSSENAPRWKRYLSLRFLTGKVREKDLIWCIYRLFEVTWQELPSDLRSFVLHVTNAVITIVNLPVSVLFYLLGIRILVNCKTGGIGHLSIEPAWFLARKALYSNGGIRGKNYILLTEGSIANNCLVELLKEHFMISRSKTINFLLRNLSRYCFIAIDIGVAPPRGTPYNTSFTKERNARHARMLKDIQTYRKNIKRHFLDLPSAVVNRGRENLELLGIKKGDWFVCLHAGEISTDGKYRYDLLRRQEISDYYEVIECIAKIGGKVVRMGDKDVPDIQDGIPLINYPKSEVKSGWMDIYLISQCRYFIGCSSGLSWTAVLFGKPLILTNVVIWHFANGFDGDIYLPKMIRSKETGEFLSVREYVGKSFHLVHWDWEVPEPYEYVPNDGEDLINAVREMEEHLTNGISEPDELQELWRNSFPWEDICLPSEVRISSSFARKYKLTIE